MQILYEVVSVILAFFIIIFGSITFYLGTRYLLLTKVKKQYDWIVLIQTVIALSWIIIFGYIAEEYIRQTFVIPVGSFGTLFIRPLILFSVVTQSVWMSIRYRFEKSGGENRWNLQKKS